ncbi:MAG: helicase SNF2, partial [Caldilineaceae bacterium]|nr:helicase SNF2 [Caldilineaceae bacterium]
LVRKPLFVVPNHMLEQFSREFYQLYPNAKLLVAGKEDLTKEKRQLFTAKAASGEWDGVIMTHSSFEKIGMSPAFQEGFVREQIADYEALLTDMKTGADSDAKRLIKRIEKQKEQWEARLEELVNAEAKDRGLTFEELGVDHLFVDEAHLFKNLETPTKMDRVAGVQTSGSLRAFDLLMKTRYLEERTAGRGVCFATGTPVSNSMVEMYTMQRFLTPGLLEERGIAHFDAWAALFGDIVDNIELSPDGQSLRSNRRFARFINLPELLQLFHVFADVRTADMLDLPRPALKGGQPTTVVCPMSEAQKAIQQRLVARYERVRSGGVDPSVDNALKITTDGRKLALEVRLVAAGLPAHEEGKVQALVENVYDIWLNTQAERATQLIFCDLGVSAKDGRFSVYQAVIKGLAAQGVPPEEIANIGDYASDARKAQLFAQVRRGDVRILLGSTAKMGTGTNVQER